MILYIRVIQVESFVCDVPARSFVKNVKSNTGYSGCDKCNQDSVCISKWLTFPETKTVLCTDDKFKMRSDEAHHHGITPLSCFACWFSY
jgi:hypothetical protein